MTLKSNIWRAIMAARMQFVLYLREKKGAVMPRGGHFIPCSDIFNGGACRTPGAHVLSPPRQTACAPHRGRSAPRPPEKAAVGLKRLRLRQKGAPLASPPPDPPFPNRADPFCRLIGRSEGISEARRRSPCLIFLLRGLSLFCKQTSIRSRGPLMAAVASFH